MTFCTSHDAVFQNNVLKRKHSLREKCPYSEFFYPYFPTFQMRENTDQKNSEYGKFSRSDYHDVRFTSTSAYGIAVLKNSSFFLKNMFMKMRKIKNY